MHKIKFLCLISFILFSVLLSAKISLAANCPSGNLYVDFEAGSDMAAGTSEETAWKHSPGDANAIGNAICTLVAGNTVNFKGGVKYRGKITVGGTGTSENSITFQTGPGWGTGNAIITGADILSKSWTRCPNASACWDNPNYENIWYTMNDFGMAWYNTLFQNNEMLYVSQSPDQPVKMNWQNPDYYHTIPYPQTENQWINDTSCKDTSVFTQSGSSYYNGSFIGAWTTDNEITLASITSYAPSTSTITYSLGKFVYTDREMKYALLNHPAFISSEGTCAVSPDGRVYLWPYGGADPNGAVLEKSARTACFIISSKSYITVNGLTMIGTYGNPSAWSEGTAVSISASDHITVSNNTMYYIASGAHFNIIDARTGASYITVSGNTIRDCHNARGIMVSGSNMNVINNSVTRVGGTGIYFGGVVNGNITSNSISSLYGIHTNGASVYQNSNNVLVEKNYFYDMGSLFTFEQSSNLTIRNNIFDGNNKGVIRSWSGMTGYVRFLNNIAVRKATGNSGGILSFSAPIKVMYNNIIDGGSCGGTLYSCADTGACERGNNIYTSYSYCQEARYGWSLGSGEVYKPLLNETFMNPVNADWHIKSGGWAHETGLDLSAYGFQDDYVGTSRPQGPAWDIGAYEYVSGTPCIHKSDLSPCDGCISEPELMAFLNRWYISSTDVTMGELMEAIGWWKKGC